MGHNIFKNSRMSQVKFFKSYLLQFLYLDPIDDTSISKMISSRGMYQWLNLIFEDEWWRHFFIFDCGINSQFLVCEINTFPPGDVPNHHLPRGIFVLTFNIILFMVLEI